MNFAGMAADDFWIWACISIAACLAGFYFAFRNLSRGSHYRRHPLLPRSALPIRVM